MEGKRRGVTFFEFSAALQSLAFKVMVLRRQEELSGPSQHGIIEIICSHDSLDDFRAIEQL